jgi:hypothetical protein
MASLKFLAGLVLAGTVSAQHHSYDPWANSGCNCTAFCRNECAINATAAANATVYRMTPFGVLSLTEKDSGDLQGDTSFVISRRTSAYECAEDPDSWSCTTMVQFQGDNPNSTDLVIALQVEWDGQWGPYLYCNDVNTSDPLGAWNCTTSLSNTHAPGFPPVCAALNYDPVSDTCVNVGWLVKSEVVADIAECCSLASAEQTRYFSYENSTGKCNHYSEALSFKACNGTLTAFYDPPLNTCNCSRVFETVGRENLTLAFGTTDVSG